MTFGKLLRNRIQPCFIVKIFLKRLCALNEVFAYECFKTLYGAASNGN